VITALATAAAIAAIAPTPAAPIVVDGKPISRGHLRHWTEIARVASGRPRVTHWERQQAASFVISLRWIRIEAREHAGFTRPPRSTRASPSSDERGSPTSATTGASGPASRSAC
jgi:hypothetical protein